MGIGWCCPRVGHARCWRCSCCNAGEVVSSDRLIDVFWGGRPPPTAPTVVHGLISRLRTALELDRAKGRPSALLPTVAGGHELAIDADDVGRQSEAPDAYRKVHAILAHEVGLPARPNAAGPIYGHPARTPLPSICPRATPAWDTGSWLPRERRTVNVIAVRALLRYDEPSIRLKVRVHVIGEDPESAFIEPWC